MLLRLLLMHESTATSEITFERHFSVEELSALWGMSDDFIRRLFLHEPGVVIFCHHRPGDASTARCAFQSPSPFVYTSA